MPASFLTAAAAHHLRATLKTFGETEVRAGGVYAWFAEEAGGTEYTVPVPVAIARPRRRAAHLAGLLETPTEDELALHCDVAALPFVPDPADSVCLLIAPAEADGEDFVPAAEGRQEYLLKTYAAPHAGCAHVRMLVSLHT